MVKHKQISALCNQIVELFSPSKIFLFGSYASGSPHPDSDVDLLVILPFEGNSPRQAAEILTKTNPSFPIDLLVRTPEQVQQRIDIGDFFLSEIVENGRMLYEATYA